MIYILGLLQVCSLYLLFLVLSEQLGEVNLKLWGAVLSTQIPILISLFVIDRRVSDKDLVSDFNLKTRLLFFAERILIQSFYLDEPGAIIF